MFENIQNTFNGLFLGFELPLYLFLLWAVCRVWRTYNKYKKEIWQGTSKSKSHTY